MLLRNLTSDITNWRSELSDAVDPEGCIRQNLNAQSEKIDRYVTLVNEMFKFEES